MTIQLQNTSTRMVVNRALKNFSAGTRSAKAAYTMLVAARVILWKMYINGRYSIPIRLRNRASAVLRPMAMPVLTSMKKNRKYNTLLRSP